MKTFGALLILLAAAPALAQQDPAAVEVPAFTLPPSDQLSGEAKAVLLRMRAARSPDFKGDLAKQRAFYQKYNDDRLAEMRRHFRTSEERMTLDGVAVDIVTPGAGIDPRNKDRVLINIHGGAFMWGSGSGALVEAIPIAATGGIKVVTVHYRLTPEHRYPAASEDVTAVYRALLKQYRPENIGIYGCSAGGIITAQSVAWISKQGLPRPGAIGTFCGTAAAFSGDSAYLGPIAEDAAPPSGPLPRLLPTAYMAGIAGDDAAAYPLLSEAETRLFPPTLLLAGSRDFAASALTLAHRRLTQAGVPSQLFLFDGLPHAFFVWPDMPESMEAYRVIARFFDQHLGKRE
ncbi:alpha/beta hydrolase [Sphingomonas sp. BT-65]|uniref:alpha/beta hydrolase n=1 Tax=Sphingomonas sp. BT-65 TaxID=2989821 RepID=UPI0022354497|nr:alpha/beta hydrolase [Sphingomonas sp. BT-65]MCW4462722.1 alpha/beta hydrolase [Sphingomonas sp. BT-65]